MSLFESNKVPSFFSSWLEPIFIPRILVLLILIFERFLFLKGLMVLGWGVGGPCEGGDATKRFFFLSIKDLFQ